MVMWRRLAVSTSISAPRLDVEDYHVIQGRPMTIFPIWQLIWRKLWFNKVCKCFPVIVSIVDVVLFQVKVASYLVKLANSWRTWAGNNPTAKDLREEGSWQWTGQIGVALVKEWNAALKFLVCQSQVNLSVVNFRTYNVLFNSKPTLIFFLIFNFFFKLTLKLSYT